MKKIISLLAFTFTFAASAQLIITDQLITSFSGGDPLTVGPGTAGYSFTVGDSPLVVLKLGVWDDSGTGLSTSHQVGIWDMTPQHNLLASATVNPSGSTVVNNFWYTFIADPLPLAPNTSYMIAARYADNDFDFARGNVASVTSPFAVIHDAYLSTGVGFQFPDLNVSGANLGFFGPNADFQVVPEPETYALVSGFALLALVVYRRLTANPKKEWQQQH